MRIACIMIFSIVLVLLLLHNILRSCSAISTSLHHHHDHVALINITTDESTLLALKSSILSDPNHTLTNNWSVAKGSCCNWVGVTCGTRHKRVVALDLSTMGLIGTIPPQIGNLSFLVSLDLSNNSFSGSLPKELSGLRRLKKISLRFNNFGGELPSWLGELTKLEYLSLAYNSFIGTIPPSFSNITKLVWLSLGSNSLRGSIPPEIGSLANLEVFDIQNNQFTGSIPLIMYNISTLKVIAFTNNSLSGNLPPDICKRIPKIEELHLSQNKLSGPIPSSLHECSKLKVLASAYNEFSGIIPREIGNLTLLYTLSLGSNYLKGTIPREIGNLYNLQILWLRSNNFTGTIPQEIGNLYNLHVMDLSFNSFTGTPDSIFNLSKIGVIEMTDNHLSGKLPSDIGRKLPNLTTLNIAGNNFTGILPDSISNATKLEHIVISRNKFSGTIPKSLGNLELLEILGFEDNNFVIEKSSTEISFITSLTNCRNLRLLIISHNSLNGYLPASIGNFSTAFKEFYAEMIRIRGILPSEIGNLSSLTTLIVGYNELTGKIPVAIRGLLSLQILYLFGNKIEGSIPDDLCLLQNLGSLHLEQNQISGPLPECLGNITSLRYLYLNSNALASKLPTHLGNLKDLLEFNASRNSFSGHLPSELGNLKVAVRIDLSHNQFSGNIPSIFGGLQNLVNLSLANNRLQGPIPDSFKYSVSLEYLDFSHNNFSGVIPKSLEALFHLRYFNVSFNSLRGEIPSEGPFKNFTSQYFMSNEALCGAPRFQVPQCHNSSIHHGSQRKKRVLLAICISLGTASIFVTLTFAFVWIRLRRKSKVPPQIDLSQLIAPLRISYYELQQASNAFSESNLLGMGSFGSVYKGLLANGTLIAIKVFNLQFEGAFKSFDVECEVLRNLRHRNICKVISSCSNLDFKALVLEYMSNGSLEKRLYSHNHFLDILQRLDIMIDVACALDYLHYGYSTTIVHCDLKPSNVLLDEDMVARLSDFGIAKLLGEGENIAQTMTLATIGYIAPEYGSEGLVSKKCDVYSYGIMLMEIFTRIKPSDEQFLGNMSLKHWVSTSFPKSLIQVIDANLLKPEDGDITLKVSCISSIMELALSCSADSPNERFDIKDVMVALKKIRLHFLANHGQT